MTYGIAIQVPEAPISEEWSWLTDVTVSYNGTEDRTPLLRYPRRTFNGSYRFDDNADLRRHIAMATKRFATEFRFPLFQYQAKLKTKVVAGADTVVVNAKRGDFRVGSRAVIIEGAKFEEVVVETVNETSLVFVGVLVNSFTARAIVCPVVTVYTNPTANVTRFNPDHAATSSFTFFERLPTLPFVSPLNEAVVSTFDGLPILPFVPIGTAFDGNVSTGLEKVDYVGLVDLVAPWTFAQWSYSVNFKITRLASLADWEYLQAFAETIQGSANPFLIATNRADFQIVTPAAAGGTNVTVKGDEYSQHYWTHGGFSRIFIDTAAGRHMAKVTGIVSVGGNDRLTFTPALPGGAGWTTGQKVGFLLKVRNDNDKITCNHYGLHTEVSMAIRTVV